MSYPAVFRTYFCGCRLRLSVPAAGRVTSPDARTVALAVASVLLQMVQQLGQIAGGEANALVAGAVVDVHEVADDDGPGRERHAVDDAGQLLVGLRAEQRLRGLGQDAPRLVEVEQRRRDLPLRLLLAVGSAAEQQPAPFGPDR